MQKLHQEKFDDDFRPLSAKVVQATIPEEEGWVDREKLLRIQGRSKKDTSGDRSTATS